jgi:hypothetical protein
MYRQQKYQLEHKKARLCTMCSRKAVGRRSLCEFHLVRRRLKMRERLGLKPWKPGGRGRPPLLQGLEKTTRSKS